MSSLMETQYGGVLRITTPRTLEKWKANGKFQAILDEGYFFGEGCGRFRESPCTCIKCRNKKIK